MPPSRSQRKARKTFSLTRESVEYLESLRKAKRAESASAVLEDLIRQQREAQETERIAASIRGYYDALTDSQVQEERAWGEFSESQFPAGK